MAAGGPARPTHSRPAPWVVAKRIRGRFTPMLTPRPDDFEATFIAIGRLASEEHYGARRTTITRWLDEAGKHLLIELRRIHVRQRKTGARVGREAAEQVDQLETESNAALGIPDPIVAARAADFLRIKNNGGWMISRTPTGNWWVGNMCRTSASLVAMAERNGFDVTTVTLRGRGGFGVGCAK